jgi:hypothetical protein
MAPGSIAKPKDTKNRKADPPKGTSKRGFTKQTLVRIPVKKRRKEKSKRIFERLKLF